MHATTDITLDGGTTNAEEDAKSKRNDVNLSIMFVMVALNFLGISFSQIDFGFSFEFVASDESRRALFCCRTFERCSDISAPSRKGVLKEGRALRARAKRSKKRTSKRTHVKTTVVQQ
jgi:hypothetical protein